MCATLKSYTYCCDIQPHGFGKLKMIIRYTYSIYSMYSTSIDVNAFLRLQYRICTSWQVPTDAYSPMGVIPYQEQVLQYYLKVWLISMSTSTHVHEQ